MKIKNKNFIEIKNVFKNYNIEILFLFIIYIVILAAFRRTEVHKNILRILPLTIYFIELSFVIRNFVKDRKKYLIYSLIGSIILGLPILFFKNPHMILLSTGLGLILFLLILLIPCRKNKNKQINYISNFITSVFYSFIISLIVFILLTIIYITFNHLVKQLDDYNYIRIIWFLVIVFPTILFFSKFETDVNKIEKNKSPIFRIILLYLFIPFFFIYTGILYLYILKILLGRTFYEEGISLLVIIHALFFLLSLILIKSNNFIKEKHVNILEKIFYITELPLTLLLMVSIIVRIKQYNLTINRYVALVFSIWMFIYIMYGFIVKKNKEYFLLRSLLFTIVVLCIGPFSILNLPFKLQKQRFNTLVQKYDVQKDGKSVENIPEKEKEDLISILDYFEKYKNNDLKKKYYPNEESLYSSKFYTNMGFSYEEGYIFYWFNSERKILNITDYDYLVEVEENVSRGSTSTDIETNEFILDEKNTLKILASKDWIVSIVLNDKEILNGNILGKELGEVFTGVKSKNVILTKNEEIIDKLNEDKALEYDLQYKHENENTKLILNIRELENNGKIKPYQIDYILIKLKK